MIDGRKKQWRVRLSYANVLATLTLFAVLAGGTAYAANQLGKNSVGSKQLKKNSVTAAKIKKNAITGAKIKNGAVTEAKFKGGSIGGRSFELDSTPYTGVVHQATAGVTTIAGEEGTAVSLQAGVYSQPPGRDDFYFGTATVTVPASCQGPQRTVYVEAYVDLANQMQRMGEEVAAGSVEAPPTGTVTVPVTLAPENIRFQPAAATNRTFTLYAEVACEGVPDGGTLQSAVIDVVGVR